MTRPVGHVTSPAGTDGDMPEAGDGDETSPGRPMSEADGDMPEAGGGHVTSPGRPMPEADGDMSEPGPGDPILPEAKGHVTKPSGPMTEPEFLVCCSCTDNCSNRSKCECWQLTLEEAKVIGNTRYSVGYVHQRLKRPQHSA